MAESKWDIRWMTLREAGLTWEQALAVFQVMDEARTFGTAHMAGIARRKLGEVFGEED